MKEGVDLLEAVLGTELFRKYIHVILTDRGSEFTAADAMETASDGTRRTRVFYCAPCNPGRKSPLELADFMYHDLYKKLEAFGIHKIEKDKVILKPYLLKK